MPHLCGLLIQTIILEICLIDYKDLHLLSFPRLYARLLPREWNTIKYYASCSICRKRGVKNEASSTIGGGGDNGMASAPAKTRKGIFSFWKSISPRWWIRGFRCRSPLRSRTAVKYLSALPMSLPLNTSVASRMDLGLMTKLDPDLLSHQVM